MSTYSNAEQLTAAANININHSSGTAVSLTALYTVPANRYAEVTFHFLTVNASTNSQFDLAVYDALGRAMFRPFKAGAYAGSVTYTPEEQGSQNTVSGSFITAANSAFVAKPFIIGAGCSIKWAVDNARNVACSFSYREYAPGQ